MRKLTLRERVLLGCLAVVAVVSGYILFFYTPIAQRTDSLRESLAQTQELTGQLEQRLDEQHRMEQVLAEASAGEDAPIPMPESDNLQAVLVELNDILDSCLEYSVSFQGETSEDHIFRRQVTIPFLCSNYQSARQVLQQLHDSDLRCLLQNVQMALQEDGTVRVTVSMVFFSYQEEAEEPAQ